MSGAGETLGAGLLEPVRPPRAALAVGLLPPPRPALAQGGLRRVDAPAGPPFAVPVTGALRRPDVAPGGHQPAPQPRRVGLRDRRIGRAPATAVDDDPATVGGGLGHGPGCPGDRSRTRHRGGATCTTAATTSRGAMSRHSWSNGQTSWRHGAHETARVSTAAGTLRGAYCATSSVPANSSTTGVPTASARRAPPELLTTTASA